MPSVRSLVLLGLQSMYIVVAQSQPEPSESKLAYHDVHSFKELLDLLPSESLHAALHGHLGPQYQDGVFEADNRAMEQIHSENPNLASRLVEIAKHDVAVKAELRKRQTTNGTVTSVTSSDTSSSTTVPIIVSDSSTTAISFTTEPVSETSAVTTASETSSAENTSAGSSVQPTSITPTVVPVTTTNSQGSSVESSITVSSAISASQPAPVTTTNSAGSTVTSTPPAITAGTLSSVSSIGSTGVGGVLVPVVVSSTNGDGSVVVSTTSALQASASVSVEQTFTTTNAQGNTVTTSARFPGVVVTTTNAAGSLVTTTSPVASVRVGNSGSILTEARVPTTSGAATSDLPDITTTDSLGNTVVLTDATYGKVITATDARGSTFITTYTPGGGAVRSLILQTTTLPDGSQSTITSFAVIGGAQGTATTEAAASSSRTATSSPGLQTGAASATRGYAKEVVALLGGAVGVAYLL